MFSGLFDFKRHKVKCPDGTERFVYKDIDHAFPLYIPGFEAKASSSVKGWEQLKGTLKADYASKIQGLLFQLDEQNQGIVIDFRAAYIAFTSDPCNNSIFFRDQIDRIIIEQRRLRGMSVQIQALMTLASTSPESSEVILKMFVNIADRIGGQPAAEAARIEINLNRQAAIDWASTKNTDTEQNEG